MAVAAERGAILYAYWLSSCSWRVRAALTLKNIPFEERTIDVVKEKKQLTEEYRAINPAQKVPALAIVATQTSEPEGHKKKLGGHYWGKSYNVVLVESMAIIQYLEDTRPDPVLSPKTPLLRARMREICEVVVSGIQPLQNFGLKPYFETEDQFQKFTKHFSERGLRTLEDLLEKTAGKYCIGDEITIADICLTPQIYNAVSRYSLDLAKYPTISNIYETLLKHEVFQKTHPKAVKPKK